MQVKELEEQIQETNREFDTKQAIMTARNNNTFRDAKTDYEGMIRELKAQIRSLQIELDVERNQQTAQEEMLNSLVHNISMEFFQFSKDNAPKQKPKGLKKSIAEGAQEAPSFLDSKCQQIYQIY